jgi:hypothetical protein
LIIKHDLILSPFSNTSDGSNMLLEVAKQFHEGREEIEINFRKKIESSDVNILEMRNIEDMIKNYNALAWLALRYPDRISLEKTKKEMNRLIDLLSNSLAYQTDLNKKKKIEIRLKKEKSDKDLGKLLEIMGKKKESIAE